MKIKTLSASAIDCYENCPKMYWYQYIEKMMGIPSDAMLIGEMVHIALKNFHLKKDPLKEIKNKILKPITKENINKFDKIRKLVDAYILNPIKDESLEYEKKFSVPFINSKKEQLEIPLIGVIDRLTHKGIIEYKTANEEYTQEKVDNHIQGTIYAYAYYYLKKKLGTVTFCILNKTKSSVQILQTERSIEDFNKFFDRTNSIYCRIKSEEFNATPGNQCFWCGYRDICQDRNKVYAK